MKKIIFIFLFIATVFAANAQKAKPFKKIPEAPKLRADSTGIDSLKLAPAEEAKFLELTKEWSEIQKVEGFHKQREKDFFDLFYARYGVNIEKVLKLEYAPGRIIIHRKKE